MVVPVVVLLGLIAGLGVLRRAWKATGIERYQLRWRAYGVVLSLLLFPLAVNQVPADRSSTCSMACSS